ncbi:MAG: ABC transporter permease [Nitrososphaerales archaeon]
MLYLLLLARRFLFRKKASTAIASTAVAATIFLSIFNTAIFTGVRQGIIEEIADFQIGHIAISNEKGLISSQDSNRINALLRLNPLVVGGTGRLTTSSDINFTGTPGIREHYRVSTFGVDPGLESTASSISEAVSEGNFIQHKNEIVIGSDILEKAGAEIGSVVTLQVNRGPDAVAKRFLIVGVSEVEGFQGFSTNAIIHISTLREMMGLDTRDSTSYLVRLTDSSRSVEVAESLQVQLPKLKVETLEENIKDFITTFNQLIAFINLIGYVGMVAAALGIIVILMMMVSGKTRDIGLLRAVGIKKRNIIILFILNGAIIGFLGAISGGIAGSIMMLYLQHNPVAFFGGISPVITFGVGKLAMPMLLGFTISILSSIYPAWKASKYLPAEAMRYF